MGQHLGHDPDWASYTESKGMRCECMHCHQFFKIEDRFKEQCPWKLEHIAPLLDKDVAPILDKEKV